MKTYKQLQERINMAKAKMGDVIKDFKDSDAPQFKGKSDEKRRQMAIAAKLSNEEVETDEYNQGKSDAKSGKKWWKNPHPSGSKAAYEWDKGHTKVRTQKEEVEQTDEELKGNQHKIDANKNGKVDGHDFKLLRGKKKVEESSDLKPFIVVHAKHGKFETHAGSTYEAAKNAAAHWKTKKGTSGMDVHRADITHSTQHVG